MADAAFKYRIHNVRWALEADTMEPITEEHVCLRLNNPTAKHTQNTLSAGLLSSSTVMIIIRAGQHTKKHKLNNIFLPFDNNQNRYKVYNIFCFDFLSHNSDFFLSELHDINSQLRVIKSELQDI